MREPSEKKRKALARERFTARHVEEIEGVLFAVSVLRGLRDRAAEFHAAGNANLRAFYLNGVLNAVDALLDKQPRIDDIIPCGACVAVGRRDGKTCSFCEGKGERRFTPQARPTPRVPTETTE